MAYETENAWAALGAHWQQTRKTRITALFDADPNRFETFSMSLGDVLFDYSKTKVTRETIALLTDLARARGVEAYRDRMFAGEAINTTEGRAVLHTALRNRSNRPILVDGKDVMPEVNAVLAAMRAFSDDVRSGAIRAPSGKPFTDVVNIGIGGSDLGPVMVARALSPFADGPRTHFVSNVDGAHIADTLAGLDPESTLFIIASKTFTTIETMTNARTARKWVEDAVGADAAGGYFAAVSTALEKVAAFGIAPDRVFGYWDWVGGRYSVWGAIGLPVMLAIGADDFEAFLAGAHEMDEHFRAAPLEENMPALLGLIGAYHAAVCGYDTRAVLPYDQRLERLPAYLQQLDMESNGKSVTLSGDPAPSTGPIVWGEPGTNGQHAFYQLLHQGTRIVPCEFMVAANGSDPALAHHHELLVANCLAQSQAMMRGRSEAEAEAILMSGGMDAAKAKALAPFKTFAGDRPSMTLMYPRLDPAMLGRIIALYEHRVFVEGVLWDINSFDQWGVELGKELALKLDGPVKGKGLTGDEDGSTAGLIGHLQGLKTR